MAKLFPPLADARHPFGDLIGLRFTRCEHGESTCELAVRSRLLNPHGVVHGGVVYSMADTGMGAALYSSLETHQTCATIEIKIAYFEAVRDGILTCDTRIIHGSRRFASLESEVRRAGISVARATGTFAIAEGRRSKGHEAS